MNLTSRSVIRRAAALAWAAAIGWSAPGPAQAQTQAQAQAERAAADTSMSHASAQSEAGEPRASTSPDAPDATGGKAPEGKAPEGKAAGSKAQGGGKSAAAVDKLQLQTATVTGDREQPKVMYIVPWKRSDIGDLSGKPMNSLLDEALAPVDRDEFKREVMYYQAVRTDGPAGGAPAKGTAPAPSR